MYLCTWIDGSAVASGSGTSGFRCSSLFCSKKKKLNDIFCYIIFDGPIDLLHKKFVLFTCLFALGSFLGC